MVKRQCFQAFKAFLICNYFLLAIGCTKDDSYYMKVRDIEGNIYNTVVIGNQRWMAENLKVRRYNDGSIVGEYTYGLDYHWIYNDDWSLQTLNEYGALYNWYAIKNDKNICPKGWHVPNGNDWTTLINYLGGNNLAGGKLKEKGTKHWTRETPNTTNGSGFTALPGGMRNSDGDYIELGSAGYWWSADLNESYQRIGYFLNTNNSIINIITFDQDIGISVRCIED